MPRRHVLYLDATQLVAWGWRAGEVTLRGRFANDAEGHAQFAEFLRQRRDSLFLLLCDLVDEAFVAESVPFVRGGDRVSLLRRKLAQHFFGTPFTCAHSLGRLRSGRRDEQMLFCALTRPAHLEPWLAALRGAEAALSGIHSVPLVSEPILERLRLTEGQTLLLGISPAGVRQSFFEGGRLRFSRLTPLSALSSNDLPRACAEEARRLHPYLLGQRLKLEYRHEPNAADDGVTLTVPLTLLNQIPAARLDWLVPGLIEEKVVQLAKTIPPKLRHRIQPISGFVADFLAQQHDQSEPLVKVLARAIEVYVSLKLPPDAIRAENLPAHLIMNIRVIDEHGRVLGQSRNLAELRTRLKDEVARRFEQARIALPTASSSAAPFAPPPKDVAPAQLPAADSKAASARGSMADALAALGARDAVAKAPVPPPAAKKGRAEPAPQVAPAAQAAGEGRYKSWAFGELPELMEVEVAGRMVIGFPALQDDGDAVSVRVFDTPEAAHEVHRRGLRRLFALELRDQVKFIEKSLPGLRDMAMQFMNLGSEAELRAQLVAATLERCCMMEPWPQDAAAFATRRDEARPRISLVAQEIGRLAGSVLTEYAALNKKLIALKAHPDAGADMRAQLDALVGKHFIERTPFERLTHYPRYLKAIALRIDKLRADPARDARAMADWTSLATLWERERIARARAGVSDPFLDEFRWLLEELRVNLFAQELRTPVPVSVKRLQKIWESRSHG